MTKIDEETLWNQMKFLYPKMTLEDFYDTLQEEGLYNTIIRIQINLRDRYQMIEKYGGDGKSRLRELYKEFS